MLLRLSIIFGAFILVSVILIAPWNLSLNKIHSGIEKRHKNVQHIDARSLSGMRVDSVVLFDVCEVDEFDVSHIQSAIQLDPDIELGDFEDDFSEIIEGKVVVFYCSVGVRSSALASQLEELLNDAGTEKFYNLTGGLFQWHNQSRPTVHGDDIPTENIHPYNDYWGQLIENKSAISYQRSNKVY